MKKSWLIFLLSILFVPNSNSQCTPDIIFTSIGLPGVYPPAIQNPNLPLPLGIADGSLGSDYNQTLTVIILEDTTMDISFLLPPAVVSAMILAGISTTMTLGVNHVAFDVQGLPNGINYQCNWPNCIYASSFDGCIQLNGIPTIAGTFSIPVNMTINIQIPTITDPTLGTVIFPSTSLDMPAFAVQTYDLFINGPTSVDEHNKKFKVSPNPTVDRAVLFLKEYSDVVVYNTLGKQVINFKNMKGNIVLNKQDIGAGLFFVNISSEDHNTITKLIIK